MSYDPIGLILGVFFVLVIVSSIFVNIIENKEGWMFWKKKHKES